MKFMQPGVCDMTADVDFAMCRQAALRKGAAVAPLLTQGEFLMRMNIVARVEQLLAASEDEGNSGSNNSSEDDSITVNTDEAEDEAEDGDEDAAAERLVESLEFLVSPEHMGKKFKVLAISSPAQPTPTGFD